MPQTDVRARLYEKTGGFIQGICHPCGETDALLEASIRWIRSDTPYPFNSDGTPSQWFLDYKAMCRTYLGKGIRVIGITPYPRAFLANGIDVRTAEGLAQAEAVCKYMAEELRGLVHCWQITNEMHIVFFRDPLTDEEATDFLIACTKGVRAGDPDCAVGSNSGIRPRLIAAAGPDDYIGLDCYCGSWGDGGPDDYVREIETLYAQGNQTPIILMEFGFPSTGGIVEDADAEIKAYLNARGFSDLDDAVERLDDFIETLPEPMRACAKNCAPEDRKNYVFSNWTHLLKKWFSRSALPHTEAGQAEFYRRLLPMLRRNEHLAGAVIFCWRDSPTCFNCGASDCPCETAWGITRCDGTRKPAYDAIREAFSAR